MPASPRGKPKSLAIKELESVLMELGVLGPKWRTKYKMEKDTTTVEEQR